MQIETVIVDWTSARSIAAAERKKMQLENDGYTLSNTASGLTSATLTYIAPRG